MQTKKKGKKKKTVADLPAQTKMLVETLLAQTEEGRRAWEKGSADTEFVFVHNAGSVIILSMSGNEEGPFELRVLDPAGRLVERHDTGDGGSEELQRLYLAARASSAKASPVVSSLLFELDPPNAERLNAELRTLIRQIDTSGNTAFDDLVAQVKPLMKMRVDAMRAGHMANMTWGEFTEPFPSGGGSRRAIYSAVKQLRDEGEIDYAMDPEPASGEKTPGPNRAMRLNFG